MFPEQTARVCLDVGQEISTRGWQKYANAPATEATVSSISIREVLKSALLKPQVQSNLYRIISQIKQGPQQG